MNKNYWYIGGGTTVLLFGLILFFSLRGTPSTEEFTPSGFGVGDNRTVTVTTETGSTVGEEVTVQSSGQLIFRAAEGPIVAATLIDIVNPTSTSTVARYVKQDNGHVFEVSLDVPGAVPRALSNTTIPGVVQATWIGEGSGVILQYLSSEIIKTVYLGFASASSTSTGQATTTRPTKIQFLPDNVRGLAASPDGARIAYLLQTANGVAGYSANADGTGSAQLFSLPLSQVVLDWPSQNALLLTTKSASGVPGMAFAINAASGVVTPLLRAEGLTATADRSFSRMVYQTVLAGASAPASYARTVQTGAEQPLSFDPYPEKCLWGSVATSTLYCAAPLEYVPANYLDLWHLGAGSVPDSIFAYDLEVGDTSVIAIPGSKDGGAPSDIIDMAVSQTERYLSFIDRSNRTLWGVKLESR